MTSTATDFKNFLGELSARTLNSDVELATVRDGIETMHLAAKEPETSATPR